MCIERGYNISVIFDVGSYIGSFAISSSEWFPAAKIFAFEPFPESFDELLINTKPYPNIKCFANALGDKEREGKLFANKKPFTNSLLPNSENIDRYVPYGMADPISQSSINIGTISSVMESNNINAIGLLKMDTQGFEYKVLKGAGEYLNPETIPFIYSEVLFVDLYKEQVEFEALRSFLESKRYRLLKLYNIHADESGNQLWADALFVPAEWAVT